MKVLFTKLLTLMLIFSCSLSYGADYWGKFNGQTAPSKLPISFEAKSYSLFTLKQNEMKGFLNALSTDPNLALEITLPAPDNSMKVFKIWKTPIFESEIAKAYPEIQTYTAYEVGNPGVTAKLDYTPFGFRAFVIDGSNSYLIDPYSEEADGYYAVFYKNQLIENSSLKGCLNGTLPDLDLGNEIILNTANKQNGSVRHIYRLAISCTGEYALSVAGPVPTVALVMSKIVSTINRVNGVYERELSVSFNIINNNDLIIFTDPNSDPYSCNDNLDCLIGEVETLISNTIGNANFDVGHILATAGGGLAALNAVCADGIKASGTSSSTGPNDFHVPLHELGHQFGANHTFSANTGGCNGNGAPTNAYEPGSGTSIMSYGGLCAPNNVNTFSAEYFHVASLKEMNNLLTTQGSTCGNIVPGTPVISYPEITDTFFNIPVNTPFELRAPLATVNQPSAVITYNWEQFDLGNFDSQEDQNASATEGPVFQSYPPNGDRSRIFPSVNYILDDTYTGVGERLPTVAREMNFKLTARSLFQGWGTFNYTDKNIKVNMTALSKFRVLSPAVDSTWNPNEVKTITWEKGGSEDDPVFCSFVNIYLSLDDGLTFPYVIVTNAPNTGSYDYTVYNVSTTKGRIKIQGTGQAFLDIGKGKLKITGTETSIENIKSDTYFAVYPNPAKDQIQIKDKVTQDEFTVIMYDILGSKVWSGQMKGETSITTSLMARGQYLIKLINEKTGETFSRKVVLN